MLLVIAILVFLATFGGGLVALRFRDKLHVILGFSAGAVIAVAFFDLLPEALEIGGKYFSSGTIVGVSAVGFLIYLALDRLIFFHGHNHENDESHDHAKEKKGWLGAGSLSVHSFLDGLSIGLAFQISSAVGIIVAIAVLVHDFSDGINTVGMIARTDGDKKTSLRWLMADSIAPVLGIIVTFFFSVPEKTLGIILALFSGFFIYIGASDLIPESHHAHPRLLTTFMTIVGALVLYLAVKLAGL